MHQSHQDKKEHSSDEIKVSFLAKVWTKIKNHKKLVIISVVVIAIIVVFNWSGIFGSQAAKPVYVVSDVKKGMVIASVSGTGQISASNQIDIKPKVSGNILSIKVVSGATVKAGAIIAQIDSQDAWKTVRDAETSLETAKLSLEKIKAPADALSLSQAEGAVISANESKQIAEDNLANSYDSGFTSVSGSFLHLSSIMTGLNDDFFVYTFDINRNAQNVDWYANQVSSASADERAKVDDYKDNFISAYTSAKASYDASSDFYRTVSRTSSSDSIEKIISQTYDTAKKISDAVKSAKNYLDLVQDLMDKYAITTPAHMTSAVTDLNSFTNTVNGDIPSLNSAGKNILNYKQSIVNADRSINEKTLSLENLKSGADVLDLRSAELTVQQRRDALIDAQNQYADYYIRAPFDGVIAKLNLNKYIPVSPSDIIATIVTPQKVATISLNEVDISKIKVGQKATLTFDAISDLTITGEVMEVDAVGTVSQGIVNYGVKMVLDAADDRIKSGMSVSASIITDSKQDVLAVPNSAVKSSGGSYYVEMPAEDVPVGSLNNNKGIPLVNLPIKQTVEIGLADDSNTEITSGLNEGDKIITKTITSSTSSGSPASSSGTNSNILRGISGGGGPSGGFGR